jgi:3-methyladenine DNA glycosylase AlkD
MPAKNKPAASKAAKPVRSSAEEVRAVLASLERLGSKTVRTGMPTRYGIHTDKAFGVTMRDMQKIAKDIGINHALALVLWDTGCYEARMIASMIDDPVQVTAAQMDGWCKTFDNWAICDTVCFKLFDRVPHAWKKVAQWSGKRDEFVKRAAYALLWSLALHDKRSGNEPFVRGLALIERAATDDRNFVKKSVNMALRAVGRRNRALNTAAAAVAQRLSESPDATARTIGTDALKELRSSSAAKR